MPDAAARRADFRVVRTIPTRWIDQDVHGHVNNVVNFRIGLFQDGDDAGARSPASMPSGPGRPVQDTPLVRRLGGV
ncbi:hypothetical protein BH18ACT8_BH18ACT8_09180 [soil metagenome]